MNSYSMDLRQRVLADCDAKMETRGVAAKYRVSESWVRRLNPDFPDEFRHIGTRFAPNP